MRKFVLIIIGVLILFFNVSCIFNSRVYHWEFEQSYTEVKEIQIVEISYNNGQYNTSVLKDIDIAYAKDIFDDIENIIMRSYGPNVLTPHGIYIKIIFNSNDYDLIGVIEPRHYYFNDETGNMTDNISHSVIKNEEQFDKLINKYLE